MFPYVGDSAIIFLQLLKIKFVYTFISRNMHNFSNLAVHSETTAVAGVELHVHGPFVVSQFGEIKLSPSSRYLSFPGHILNLC